MRPQRRARSNLLILLTLAAIYSPTQARADAATPQRYAVEIRADCETKRYQVVPGHTVGEILRAVGVSLGPTDRVKPSARTLVFDKLSITVLRVRVRDAHEVGRVPYQVMVVEDRDLREGLVRMTAGAWSDGVSDQRVRYYERDDGVVERVVLETYGETVMRPKVITIGTKGASPSRGSVLPGRELEVEATAYSPDVRDGDSDFDTTSIGLPAGRGIVAVDPNVIPYGTKLFIEGYGWAVAGDTGGAIRGRRIDLCYDARSEALAFGTRTVKVRLYD